MKLLNLQNLLSWRSLFPRVVVKCIFNHQMSSYHPLTFVFHKKIATPALTFTYLNSSSFSKDRTQTATSQGIVRLNHLFSVAHKNVISYGRLSPEDVTSLIKQTKLAGTISYTQSLFLIRCLGLLLPEASSETRINMLEQVLQILKSQNLQLDITHYNSILAVNLENEVVLNPFDYLKMLKEIAVSPNQVTFQKIVSTLCQTGDLSAVTDILKVMKETNLKVDIHILNAIVRGHSRNGDWGSAEETIEMIKKAGLEPDSKTYCALLDGYAKHGLRERILSVIDHCKANDITIRDREILDLAYVAAMNGHLDIIDCLLTLTRKDWGYNRACVNLVFRLVSEKREEAAFKILLNMKPILSREGRTLPSGNFFIRHLIRSGCPPEKTINFCQELVANGKNSKAFFKALEVATFYNDTIVTSHVMRKLQGRKESTKPHLYGPLLISRARTSGEDGVLKLLWEMKSVGANATVDIVIRCILPHLTGDVQTVLQKLLDSGISFYVSVMSLLQYSIECHDFNSAVWLASNYYTGLDVRLRKAVVKAYLESRDSASLGKLIRALLPLPREIDEDDDLQDSSNQLIDSILKDICEQASNIADVLFPLLEALNEQGLSISVSSSQRLREALGEQMDASFDRVLSLLESNKLLNCDAGNSERLNVGSDLAVRSVKEFHQYVRSQDINSVLKCKEVLEAKHVPLSDGMNVSLMMTYVKNGNLDEALALFSELVVHGAKIYLPNLLTLATHLLTEGRAEDTSYVLDHLDQTRTADLFVTEDRARVGMIRILNVAASQGDVELTRSIFDKLKSRTTIDRKLLSPLVKGHLVRGDIDGALNEFKHCVAEYRCTPGKTNLLDQLIETKDEARLNTVIELSNKVDGEKNSLHDLAFSYLRCGHLDKAQTVFQTPGLRALNKRLDDVFRYNCSTHSPARIQEMEKLLKITKSLFNIDRLMLYNHMLTAYIDTDQPSKAANLWTQLQQENEVTPDENFVLRLGNFLRSKSFSVPFTVPLTIPAQVRDGVSSF